MVVFRLVPGRSELGGNGEADLAAKYAEEENRLIVGAHLLILKWS